VDASDRVFRKTHASCFFGTDLYRWLREASVDGLVIAGFTTSGCVRASAVDALQNDYRTTVIEDAVGDRDPAAHAANLYDIEAKYGDVRSLVSLLA
jgi:nicotinamidase-related amidase